MMLETPSKMLSSKRESPEGIGGYRTEQHSILSAYSPHKKQKHFSKRRLSILEGKFQEYSSLLSF
jgi:hypothetical protein